MYASENYSTGDYILIQGKLYRAIANISDGDLFDNTNVTACTVGEELTSLTDHLANILKTSVSAVSFTSVSSEYTAPSAGLFCGYARKSSNLNAANITLNSTIKGNSFLIITSNQDGQYIPVTIPLAKGEKITVGSWLEFNYLDGKFQGFE